MPWGPFRTSYSSYPSVNSCSISITVTNSTQSAWSKLVIILLGITTSWDINPENFCRFPMLMLGWVLPSLFSNLMMQLPLIMISLLSGVFRWETRIRLTWDDSGLHIINSRWVIFLVAIKVMLLHLRLSLLMMISILDRTLTMLRHWNVLLVWIVSIRLKNMLCMHLIVQISYIMVIFK